MTEDKMSTERLEAIWRKHADPHYYTGLRVRVSSPLADADGYRHDSPMPWLDHRRPTMDRETGDRPWR